MVMKENFSYRLKKIIKEKNASIQNLPIIYKNTSKSLEKIARKKNISLNEELKLAKSNHFSERKNLDRIISNFKEQLDNQIMENNVYLEDNIKLEEHNSRLARRQSIKSIKINL